MLHVAHIHFKLEKTWVLICSATSECSHDNANKMLLPIFGPYFRIWWNNSIFFSGGNINDSCEDGMIISSTSSQRT